MNKKSNKIVLTPEERTKWFCEVRFGMFIHWGIYSIPSQGEWAKNSKNISEETYQQYFETFNPVRYDPTRWAAIARETGMKYAVLTAKHHDGFCLFDSQLTDYKSTNTPAGRDLVKEYVEAFRAAGLKVGLYYSLLDWHHPEYTLDAIHPRRNDELFKAQKRDQGKYIQYLHGQVRELLSNYGPLDIMWFDFSFDEKGPEEWGSADLLKMVRSLQPNIIIDSRLDRGHLEGRASPYTGDFMTPEQIIPEEGLKKPSGEAAVWESCLTMNDNWGYTRDDKNFTTTTKVIRMLVECVSKGGNLLLNVGPTAKGEVQPECLRMLSGVGEWMRLNSDSIYGCDRVNLPKPQWGRWTGRGNTLYAHVFDPPAGLIVLPGWLGKVRYARLLSDGTEISTAKPWMVQHNMQDAFLIMPSKAAFDPHDTVIEIELAPDALNNAKHKKRD